ncbi:MAG TPA: sugar ABC transporter permease [Symbiobacteriaceae bacterium]|nr:sugar ABC transporter permease [Symbiobacteriaceae bacterium]
MAELKHRGLGKLWLVIGLFLAPALIFYTLFLIVPLIGTLLLSLTHWNGYNFAMIKFAGLANFKAAAADPVFWQALSHNLYFLAGALIVNVGVALFFALALDQKLPLTNLFRGIYLMPAVISLVVTGVVFNLVLSPSLGLINPFLTLIGLEEWAGEWLGNPSRVLPVLVFINCWQGFGLSMFLFIARLVAIPEDLHEAAFVDGANRFQDIWYVTLPMLKNTVAVVTLLEAINSLKTFSIIYVMTKGGPNHKSEVLSSWGYFQAFTANKVGYGSAILVVLLLLTFMLAYVHVTRFQSREE